MSGLETTKIKLKLISAVHAPKNQAELQKNEDLDCRVTVYMLMLSPVFLPVNCNCNNQFET